MPKRVVRKLMNWDHVGRAAYLVTCIVCAVSFTIGFFWLKSQNEKINRHRIQVSYDTCKISNERNLNTKDRVHQLTLKSIATVDKQVKEGKITERAAKVLREQRIAGEAPVAFLIDGLTPYQDCEKQLVKRFGKHALDHLQQ